MQDQDPPFQTLMHLIEQDTTITHEVFFSVSIARQQGTQRIYWCVIFLLFEGVDTRA